MKPLVSIITPCYNGEKFIDGYMKSILAQDYSNCQLIFMDDGSTDSTKGLIEKYKAEIEDKEFQLEYHYHPNMGVGATIAEGIKYVIGDYYIWPDIDDFLAPNSISKKVAFLENHKEYGLVRTECKVVIEDDLETAVDYPAKRYRTQYKEDLFENCLLFKDFYFQPGCYMIRTSALEIANPERYIYPSRYGQGVQMLLPILYNFKCGYIDEPLFIYVKRGNSLSNSIKKDYQTQVNKWGIYEDIVLKTIQNTNISEKDKYSKMVKSRFPELKLDEAFKNGKRIDACEFYSVIKKNTGVKRKLCIKALMANNALFKALLRYRYECNKNE